MSRPNTSSFFPISDGGPRHRNLFAEMRGAHPGTGPPAAPASGRIGSSPGSPRNLAALGAHALPRPASRRAQHLGRAGACGFGFRWGVDGLANGDAHELIHAGTSPTVAESMKAELEALLKLSRAERLQLVEDLWDSIAQEEKGSPVSEEKRDELRRRKERFLRHPASGRTWELVKERARGAA